MCTNTTEFDARILQLVLTLTRQFMLVVPVISVVGIALSYNASLGRDALVWQLLRLLLLGSSLLALWCVVPVTDDATSQPHRSTHIPPYNHHTRKRHRGLFILWKATLTDQSARHARISLKARTLVA